MRLSGVLLILKKLLNKKLRPEKLVKKLSYRSYKETYSFLTTEIKVLIMCRKMLRKSSKIKKKWTFMTFN